MDDSSTTAGVTDDTSYNDADDGVTTNTIRRVKKEVEVYNNNNHNDDDDDNNNIGTGNRNLKNRLMVKKEEEEEEEEKEEENNKTPTPESSSDGDYSDWKNGNWCWLLPVSTTNNRRRRQQIHPGQNNGVNCTTHSVKSEEDHGNTTTNAATSATTTTGMTVAATSTAKQHPSGTKIKMERRSMAHNDNDDDDDENNPPPKKKKKHYYRPINATVKKEEGEGEGEEEEEEINAYEASNTTTNDNDKYKDNKGDNDEGGYESWVEGNWCWILPSPPAAVNEIKTTGPSTKSRRRVVVRNRNSRSRQQQQSSTTTVVGVAIGDDPYEDDGGEYNGDYNADNDDDDNIPSSRSKTKGKSTKIRYTRWHNERWDESFQRLVTYKKQHGSANVPNRYEVDPKLGKWVATQRCHYKNKNLSVERIRRLDYIGFVWSQHDEHWMEMYQKHVAYEKQKKSTKMPRRYTEDPQLREWVFTQRACYNKKYISIDRVNLLESIGFVWDPRDAKWMEMYHRLVSYKKQYNSTQVPCEYIKDHSLGNWVSNQRKVYNNTATGVLSKKRLELLNSIQFTWSEI